MMIAAANTGNHRQDRALVTPHENTFNEKAGGDNDDINCKLSEKVFIVYRVDRRRMVGWCSHACLLIRSHLPPHHSSVTTVSPSLTNYTVIRSSFLSSSRSWWLLWENFSALSVCLCWPGPGLCGDERERREESLIYWDDPLVSPGTPTSGEMSREMTTGELNWTKMWTRILAAVSLLNLALTRQHHRILFWAEIIPR